MSPLTTERRATDLQEGLEFGNHTGVQKNRKFFQQISYSEVQSGFYLLLPLHTAPKIPNSLIALHNVIKKI